MNFYVSPHHSFVKNKLLFLVHLFVEKDSKFFAISMKFWSNCESQLVILLVTLLFDHPLSDKQFQLSIYCIFILIK